MRFMFILFLSLLCVCLLVCFSYYLWPRDEFVKRKLDQNVTLKVGSSWQMEKWYFWWLVAKDLHLQWTIVKAEEMRIGRPYNGLIMSSHETEPSKRMHDIIQLQECILWSVWSWVWFYSSSHFFMGESFFSFL